MDWARVKELHDDLGVEDFEEITALFLEEVEERLAILSGGRSTSVAEDLHFLKGSAANLGFSSFRTACEAMERSKDLSGLPELTATYRKSKTEFIAGLTAEMTH